ncbi:MAG: hypothetical protein REI45_09105, partial [Propionicimonas sp.]|nr:hypothetical protein [Propionicimonas sp.]
LDTVSAAVVRGRAADATASGQLRAIITELFALPPQGRAVIRLAMHDLRHLPEADQAAFGLAYHDRFLQPLADVVQAGSAAGEFEPHDPITVVWIILGMLYPFLARRPSGGDDEKAVADLLDVLLTGLQSRPSPAGV